MISVCGESGGEGRGAAPRAGAGAGAAHLEGAVVLRRQVAEVVLGGPVPPRLLLHQRRSLAHAGRQAGAPPPLPAPAPARPGPARTHRLADARRLVALVEVRQRVHHHLARHQPRPRHRPPGPARPGPAPRLRRPRGSAPRRLRAGPAPPLPAPGRRPPRPCPPLPAPSRREARTRRAGGTAAIRARPLRSQTRGVRPRSAVPQQREVISSGETSFCCLQRGHKENEAAVRAAGASGAAAAGRSAPPQSRLRGEPQARPGCAVRQPRGLRMAAHLT